MKKLLALAALVLGFSVVSTVEAVKTRSTKGTDSEAPKAPAKKPAVKKPVAKKPATRKPVAPIAAEPTEEAFPDRDFTVEELEQLEAMALADGNLQGMDVSEAVFPDRDFTDAELKALEKVALKDGKAKESEVTEEVVAEVKAENSFFAPVVKAYNTTKDAIVEHPYITAGSVVAVAAVTAAVIYRKEIAQLFNKNKKYSTLAQLSEARQQTAPAA